MAQASVQEGHAMPTEELEQALLAAKWGSAEVDAVEVVARLLELPREAVVRVQYALQASATMKIVGVMSREDELPEELQTAMKAQLRRGLGRVLVRNAIRDEETLQADIKALIKKPHDVCRGCEFSLNCVTKGYSTPKQCFKEGPPVRVVEREKGVYQLMRLSHGGVVVHPKHIRGDLVTVACAHPLGTYDVDVEELWP
jgi:hypothetical protein